MASTPPCSTARSVSSRIRFLSSAPNLRRCALAGTSGSGELATKGTAILASLTMILLAALLCNYGRGKCLIDVGTEGKYLRPEVHSLMEVESVQIDPKNLARKILLVNEPKERLKGTRVAEYI